MGTRALAEPLGYPRPRVHATSNPAPRRRRCQRLLLSVLALVAAVGSARPAFCTEVTDFIRGDAACPDPKAVEAEVFKLTSAEGRAAHLPGARVRIFDEGDRYGVDIDKEGETYSKSYDDPARACDQRARVVAVAVVMTLIPAELSAETPDAAAAEEPPDAPADSATDAAQPRSEPEAPAAAVTEAE